MDGVAYTGIGYLTDLVHGKLPEASTSIESIKWAASDAIDAFNRDRQQAAREALALMDARDALQSRLAAAEARMRVLEEALIRARLWGIGGKSYITTLACDLAEWVDSEMEGPLPPITDNQTNIVNERRAALTPREPTRLCYPFSNETCNSPSCTCRDEMRESEFRQIREDHE